MESVTGPFTLKRWKISPVMAVFLAALVVRLWVLCRAADRPEFLPNQGDMKFYSEWARRIAGGTLTDHQAFYGLPGYAYLLAAVYKLVGFQPFVAALLQVITEAFTATIIFRLAALAFARHGEPAHSRSLTLMGALAALGWVFFVPAQAYGTILMPTVYLVAAFWFVVWWTLRRRVVRPSAGKFLGLGLLAGVVAMMVANILFLIPLVLAAIWLRDEWGTLYARPFTPRARWLASAALVGGMGLGVLPCALHNYLLAGEPVVLSAHSGINFFIGNNAQANGYPQIPAPLHADQQGMLKDSIFWAERAAGHPLKRVEVSVFWSSLARQYIREHPGDWLRLEAKKLGNFWSGFQYDDLGVLGTMKENGVLLPGPTFGWVVVLALPGLLLAAARRPRAWWIILAVALHMASLLTVFVTERYRLAAVPGLLLLGSFGVVEGWRELRARHWLPLTAYATALALACLLVNRPVDPALLYLDDYNSSLADLEQGRFDRAQHKLERVLLNNQENAETHFALGNLWLARGDRDKAKGFYRRTLQLDPRHDRALNNLGVLAIEEKRWPLAEVFLSNSLQIDPGDAKTNYLLAEVRYERHDLDGAHAAMTEALRLRPGEPSFHKLSDRLEASRATLIP